MDEGDELLTTHEVCSLLYVTRWKLDQLVQAGEMAGPARIGKRSRRWRRADVEAYLHRAEVDMPTYVAVLRERQEAMRLELRERERAKRSRPPTS